MSVSVVIPYRSDNGGPRDKIMDWTVRRYGALLPRSWEVIVGYEPEQHEMPIEHFQRSAAINNGVRQARHSVLLIADSDVVFFRDAIEDAVDMLAEFEWVTPYNKYRKLTEESTKSILASPPNNDPTRLAVAERTYDGESSIVVIAKSSYLDTGGFDERFVGWGPEDQAWYIAANTFLGPSTRVRTRDCLHLWHPEDPLLRHHNPYYERSMELWGQYKAAEGDPDALRRLQA